MKGKVKNMSKTKTIMKITTVIAGIILLVLTSQQAIAKLGIISKFFDTVLENLQPGSFYNLRALKGIAYIIKNASNEMIDVVVEVQRPANAAEGYEPILDPSWVKIVPDRFKIRANENHFSDVILSIPDDPNLIGRHFHAKIWAHTAGRVGVSVGVRNRIRFSVGSRGPESLKREKRMKKMMSIDCSLDPPSQYVIGVKPGKEYDAKKEKNVSVKITNRASTSIKLELKCIKPSSRAAFPYGYEPADISWLTIKPKVIKVKPLRIKEAKFYINIPDEEENYGKKYAFFVYATVADTDIPLQVFSRVYVETIEKTKINGGK